MIATLIEWTWALSTGVGALASFYFTRESHRDLVRAKDEEEERLILNARMTHRSALAWFIAFALFAVIGLTALFRPNVPRRPADLIIPFLLIAAVAQVVLALVRNWRDSRQLYRLIEADIRRRLRPE